MDTLLLVVNWLLLGGIVLGLAGVAIVFAQARKQARAVGVGGWLFVAGVVAIIALQVPRWSDGQSLNVEAGPTWNVKNPWGWTIATLGPNTTRGLHSNSARSTSAVTAGNRLQTDAGGPTARTVSVSWESLTVETSDGSWTFDNPPTAATLGYPADIVAMLGTTGGLNPHTFNRGGPVFGGSEGRRMLASAANGDPVEVFWGDHWEAAVVVDLSLDRYKLRREGASQDDWVRPFLVRARQ